MASTVKLASGVRITLPDGVSLRTAAPPTRRDRSARPASHVVPLRSPEPQASDEAHKIAQVLANQDMVLVDTLPLVPAPPAGGATRSVSATSLQEAAVEVDLAADEQAVILLEQDGLYAWHFAATHTDAAAAAANFRPRGPGVGRRTAIFRIPLGGAPSAPARTRGWISDLLVGQVQAFVFKYAGRFLLGQGAVFLERKVRTGLVVLAGDDPSGWQDLADFSALELPEDRPARILLFVHGTFSSTRGGFAGLCATPWGRTFLAAARANYDVLVGFDHPTLSVDPLVNATALFRSLETRPWSQPATLDVITHSRGGIVLRSLTEHLLPAASLPVRVERVVFVGVVNAGTELAEPKNWATLITLYTNLAAAACRAMAMFPHVTFAATLIGEMLKSVGVLAKVLAREAMTDDAIPGLAAMQPTGAFITELNQTQPGQPTPAQSQYYAVTSRFRAELALDSLRELPRKMLLALADGAVDQLMGVANDLVVNTDSMTRIDPAAGVFIKDAQAFGENGVVYHTNYFLQPRVTEALARWLKLELPSTASPARTRGIARAGAIQSLDVPASLDIDVLTVDAHDYAKETLARIRQAAPSHVVVARRFGDGLLHYAFRTEEVLAAIDRPQRNASYGDAGGLRLEDALHLHEADASLQGPVNALPKPSGGSASPSAGRVVGMDGDRIVGVAESVAPPQSLPDLVRLAEQIDDKSSLESLVLARRTLPSLQLRGEGKGYDGGGGGGRDRDGGGNHGAIVMGIVSPIGVVGKLTKHPRPPKRGGKKRNGGGAATGGSPVGNPVTGTSGQAGGAGEGGPAPAQVTCHFLAQMDDEAIVGHETSVDVTLSRETIQAIKAVTATKSANVETGRKLKVELIPRKNFETAGDTRIDVDVPAENRPQTITFDVKATDEGDGEILVRIRQGMQSLADLLLRCRLVKVRSHSPVRQSQETRIVETPPVQQPLHQLTIMEIERGGDRMYYYDLESPTLNLNNICYSERFQGDREAYINGIYANIEDRYLANKDDYDAFERELQYIGADLWAQLFPKELQQDLWRCRDQIESIQVYSEEPLIPWELVHLVEPGQGVGKQPRFFGQMGVVRWLHNVGWPVIGLRARKEHCRHVVPRYSGSGHELPEAVEEEKFLVERLGSEAVNPRPGPVRDLLETPGSFDLLHFACHGAADSTKIRNAEILLEGRVDGNSYVFGSLQANQIQQMSSLVSGPDGVHPIVVLNACQGARAGYKMTTIGGFARAFLSKGAGMFVGAMWSVGDQPARKFMEKLYDRLLAGDTLAAATVAAREEGRQSQEATWLAYTVYGNPNATLKP